MKVRHIVAAGVTGLAVIGTPLAVGIATGGQANAASSNIETITESKVMLTSNCYETYTTETTYYTHSVTKGWVKEPSPKVVKTKKETCDK